MADCEAVAARVIIDLISQSAGGVKNLRGKRTRSAVDAAERHQRIINDCGAIWPVWRRRAHESVKQRADDVWFDIADDEDHAGAAIVIRPAFEAGDRMHEMLHGMNHCWPIGLFGEFHHPLKPQQVRSMK